MVRTITLNDGKRCPALAWGTASGPMFGKDDLAAEMGSLVLQQGLKHIDTAERYGNEAGAGEAVRKSGVRREDMWMTTKIGQDKIMTTTPEEIGSHVRESIKKLGFIPDLYLVHNPFIPEPGKIAEFWKILEGFVEDGTLKGCSLGVSNFRPQDIEEVLEVAKIKPVCNQVEFHPYVLSHLDPLLKLQKKHDILIAAYGPLTPLRRHPTGGPLLPVLQKIAARLNKDSPAASGDNWDESTVLLLWTMGIGAICVTSSATPSRIEKLGRVDGLPDLKKEEIEEIERVARQVHFRSSKAHMTEDFPEPDLPSDL